MELATVMSIEQPGALTGRSKDLLEALRKNGGWMSRAELAHATGKRRLSPHDVNLLQRMISAGLIEIQDRPSVTPVGMAYEYKAV